MNVTHNTPTKDPVKSFTEASGVIHNLFSFMKMSPEINKDSLQSVLEFCKATHKSEELEEHQKLFLGHALDFLEHQMKTVYLPANKIITTHSHSGRPNIYDRYFISRDCVMGTSGKKYLSLSLIKPDDPKRILGSCDQWGWADYAPSFAEEEDRPNGPWYIALTHIASKAWKGETTSEDGLTVAVIRLRSKGYNKSDDDTVTILETEEGNKAKIAEFFRRTKLKASDPACKMVLELVLKMSKSEYEKWKQENPRHTSGTNKKVTADAN